LPEYLSKILVVANRTALSAGLADALRARLAQGPAEFTLVVPLGPKPGARETAQRVEAQLREAGLQVRAHAGDADPVCAVMDIWSPAEYDEIIVSTLPAWKSRWMEAGLIQRLERSTGALVHHIEAVDHHPAGRVIAR
jgi:hypothetical protein